MSVRSAPEVKDTALYRLTDYVFCECNYCWWRLMLEETKSTKDSLSTPKYKCVCGFGIKIYLSIGSYLFPTPTQNPLEKWTSIITGHVCFTSSMALSLNFILKTHHSSKVIIFVLSLIIPIILRCIKNCFGKISKFKHKTKTQRTGLDYKHKHQLIFALKSRNKELIEFTFLNKFWLRSYLIN